MARTIGVIGRFQPFHWGHFEYLVHAARLGGRLRVGISNPDAAAIRHTSVDRTRSVESSNPFSYDSRCSMIALSMESLVPDVVPEFRPCDLRSAARLRASLGDCSIVALTLYDEWSQEKKALVEEAGYQVHVLWKRQQKIVCGSDVRKLLRTGRPWEHLVPCGSRRVIDDLIDRTS